MKTLITVTMMTVAGMAAPSHAGSIDTELCSELNLTLDASARLAVPLGAEVEGGIGWGLGFVGNLSGKFEAGADVGTHMGGQTRLKVTSCVKSEHLEIMYRNNLLTAEQREAVMLYMGNSLDNSEQNQEVTSALLAAANLTGLQARRTEAVYRPVAGMMDIQARMITGEISALDTVDETVYAIKGLAAAMPLPPELQKHLYNFDSVLTKQVVAVNQGLEGICDKVANGIPGPGSDALDTFCDSVLVLNDGGEALQTNLRSVVGLIDTVGGQVAKAEVVLDGVVTVAESVDGAMAKPINTLNKGITAIGDTTRQVAGVTTRVNDSIGTMTSSLSTVTSAANSAIAKTMSLVAAPLKVLSELSGSALDKAVSTLQGVNNTLEGLVGDLKS